MTTSSAIGYITAGLTASMDWIKTVFNGFADGGAFVGILPLVGILCGVSIASWGLNKVTGLFSKIG